MEDSLGLNVAFVHTALGRFGGGERLCILHAVQLRKMGIDVSLFYRGSLPHSWLSLLKSHKINTMRLPLVLNGLRLNLRELLKTIQHLGVFDIVLIHHHTDPILKWLVCRRLGRKVVWYSGEPLRAVWEEYVSGQNCKITQGMVLDTSQKLYGPFFSTLLGLLYTPSIHMVRALDLNAVHNLGMVIANSHFTKKVITTLYQPRNIDVVYPGVSSELLCRKSLKKPSESRLILSVGALIPMKNYIRLIQSLKIVQRRCSHISLIIVGEGPLRENLLKAGSDLKSLRIFSGVTDRKLMRLYSSSRFLVHAAISEPFGLAPIEAALFGRPSIVSRGGGTSETVIHNKTGLLVNPYDISEIAEAMETLIQDDKLVDKMGLEARCRVLNNFTIEKSTKSLLKVLESHTG